MPILPSFNTHLYWSPKLVCVNSLSFQYSLVLTSDPRPHCYSFSDTHLYWDPTIVCVIPPFQHSFVFISFQYSYVLILNTRLCWFSPLVYVYPPCNPHLYWFPILCKPFFQYSSYWVLTLLRFDSSPIFVHTDSFSFLSCWPLLILVCTGIHHSSVWISLFCLTFWLRNSQYLICHLSFLAFC